MAFWCGPHAGLYVTVLMYDAIVQRLTHFCPLACLPACLPACPHARRVRGAAAVVLPGTAVVQLAAPGASLLSTSFSTGVPERYTYNS